MTPAELRAKAESAHGGVCVFTVPKKRPPGNTAALLPGLNGRVVAYDGQRATLMVDAAKVIAWLDRRASGGARP